VEIISLRLSQRGFWHLLNLSAWKCVLYAFKNRLWNMKYIRCLVQVNSSATHYSFVTAGAGMVFQLKRLDLMMQRQQRQWWAGGCGENGRHSGSPYHLGSRLLSNWRNRLSSLLYKCTHVSSNTDISIWQWQYDKKISSCESCDFPNSWAVFSRNVSLHNLAQERLWGRSTWLLQCSMLLRDQIWSNICIYGLHVLLLHFFKID